jgi:RNA polymerase sigma-70 factor (ECF subfamily)
MNTHTDTLSHERNQRLAHCLSRSALGDREAFRELYELSSGRLFAVVLRIQRERGKAEELLQEIYVAVWKSAGSFDAQRSQPLTWLTQIARNKAIDSLRRERTQPRLESLGFDDPDSDAGEALEQVPDDSPGPAALLERAGELRELQHCMQELTAQQRQSLALAFYDGLSHSEVADHLRQPLGTVKSWLRRALGTLKGCLDRAARRDATASS